MRARAQNRQPNGGAPGFSLLELLIVVSIMATIAAIGITAYTKTVKGVRGAVAWDKAEILNLGIKKYSQIVHDVPTVADNDSTDDEFLVLRSLQWRDPLDPSVDSPYVRQDYNPVGSDSTEVYRIRWNGFVFEVLDPGEAGSGMKVVDDGSDITTNHTFAADYTPE